MEKRNFLEMEEEKASAERLTAVYPVGATMSKKKVDKLKKKFLSSFPRYTHF